MEASTAILYPIGLPPATRVAELEEEAAKLKMQVEFYRESESSASTILQSARAASAQDAADLEALRTQVTVQLELQQRLYATIDGLRLQVDNLSQTAGAETKELMKRNSVLTFQVEDLRREVKQLSDERRILEATAKAQSDFAKTMRVPQPHGAAGPVIGGHQVGGTVPPSVNSSFDLGAISSVAGGTTTVQQQQNATGIWPVHGAAVVPGQQAAARRYEEELERMRSGVLHEQLKTLKSNLDDTRFLLEEERAEAAKYKLLYGVFAQFARDVAPTIPSAVEVLPAAATTQPSSSVVPHTTDASVGAHTVQVRPAGSPLRDGRLATAAAAMMEEPLGKMIALDQITQLANDYAELRRSHAAALQQIQQLQTKFEKANETVVKVKEHRAAAEDREKHMETMIQQVHDDEVRRRTNSTEKQQLDAALVAVLAMINTPIITSTNHLRDVAFGTLARLAPQLSDEKLVYEAMLDALLSSMNRQLVNQALQSGGMPLTTLVQAQQCISTMPDVHRFLPIDQFVQLLDRCEFTSETQAYALAMSYLAKSPCFVHNTETVERVLGTLRFLWLPVAFLESELANVKPSYTSLTPRPAQDAPTDRYRITQQIQAALRPRLEQSLRFKAYVLPYAHATTAASIAVSQSLGGSAAIQSLPSGNPLQFASPAVAPAILEEAQRIRPSYAFLPPTLRALQLESGASKMTVAEVCQLQVLCV